MANATTIVAAGKRSSAANDSTVSQIPFAIPVFSRQSLLTRLHFSIRLRFGNID